MLNRTENPASQAKKTERVSTLGRIMNFKALNYHKKIIQLLVATLVGFILSSELIADTSTTKVSKKPITVLAWNLPKIKGNASSQLSPYPNLVRMFWLRKGGKPEQVKQALDQLPAGQRAIFAWDFYRDIYKDPADQLTTDSGDKFTSIWWDHGIAKMEKRYDDFFKRYKELGGKLDYYIQDAEHWPGMEMPPSKVERWKTTAKDPRFKKALAAMHLKSAADIYTAKPYSRVWGAYSGFLAEQYYNRLMKIIKKYYPNVKSADYETYFHGPCKKLAFGVNPNLSNIPGGKGYCIGTHQSPSLYGVITGYGQVMIDGKPFGHSHFRSLMFTTNKLRESMLSSDMPIMPWIGPRDYDSDFVVSGPLPNGRSVKYSTLGNSDCWQEAVIHTCMCNPDALLLWNNGNAVSCNILNNLMSEINGMIGYNDRRTLVTAETPPFQPFILSGCIANGQSVWRLTPDSDQIYPQIYAIKTKDSPLTFKLGNTTLVMAGGKLITPRNGVSPAGYWIVGPADLKPSITQ